ncbi:MAG TPA: tyrosine-type recombinase/integrase, partial [Fimbriimonas sp.]|nr:tyrosine-type recombinase/integrase [Fimbriimonas sp.]
MARKKEGRRDNNSGQIVEDGKFFRARVEIGKDARTGKPKYKTARCRTRTEAVEALDRLLGDRRAGAVEQTGKANFGQFLDSWLETSIKPTRSHNTHRQYEWLVREHIKPHLGSKQADKILRADVQRLLALKAGQTVAARDKERKSKPQATLSGNTLRLIKAVLHASFEEAKLRGLTTRNPAESVELPRKKAESKKQFLTPEEARQFIRALDECDLGDFLAFLIATGTRIGEASGVRSKDLDFSIPGRPLVWIRGQLQRQGGKLVYVPGTKTNQERCLPLTPSVAGRIQAIQAKRLVEPAADEDGLVFLNAVGRRLDPRHVNVRLAEVCRRAEIPAVSAH